MSLAVEVLREMLDEIDPGREPGWVGSFAARGRERALREAIERIETAELLAGRHTGLANL